MRFPKNIFRHILFTLRKKSESEKNEFNITVSDLGIFLYFSCYDLFSKHNLKMAVIQEYYAEEILIITL